MHEERSNHHVASRLGDWWRAEVAGDEAAAEAALFSLFAALPEAAPATDLAARVLARTRLSPALDPRLRWAARALLLAAVGAAGASLLLVLPLLGLLPRMAPGFSADAFAGALSWWVGPLELVLTFLRVARGLAEAVATAAATPEVGLFFLVSVLLGSSALLGLGRLLDPRRSFHAR